MCNVSKKKKGNAELCRANWRPLPSAFPQRIEFSSSNRFSNPSIHLSIDICLPVCVDCTSTLKGSVYSPWCLKEKELSMPRRIAKILADGHTKKWPVTFEKFKAQLHLNDLRCLLRTLRIQNQVISIADQFI